MQDTTLKDLALRFGYPYLFCHQGNCEHIVVLNQARQNSELDPKSSRDYPRQVFSSLELEPMCRICDQAAERVTFDDLHAPEQSFLWCDQCYISFHLGTSGNKLFAHQVCHLDKAKNGSTTN